jgi:hypothetical protein
LVISGDSQAGTDESLTLFRNPSHAFQPAAYWFWHRLPESDQIASQLAEFSQAGFGTIMIQARLAFARADYLSADYLAAYREAVEIAGGLGLKIGLYDDYNWISGHAGGRTVEGRDHLRERHLFWSSTRTPAGAISGIASPFIEAMGPDIARWQYEDGHLAWTEWTVLAALLHPEDNIEDDSAVADVTARVILTEQSDQSCRFAVNGAIPEGYAVTVFISARARTSRLINYLLPEAAERFVAVGLDPFATALRGLMPDPVRVLFFDQPGPGFYRWDQHSGNLGNSPLYAETLRAAFASRCEAPFALALLALVRDVGPRTVSLRCAFYETYAGMMHEAFLGNLAKWTRRYGLELSGHEILAHVGAWGLNQGFRSIDPRVAIGVDHFGVDGFRTETAVDANNFEAQLAPKLGDSVARAHGRSRCVVETYATSLHADVRASGQWDLTLATMRAQAIRLAFLGARQFLIHALWQTDGFDGDDRPFVNPRFDFAPGINFEPWWPYVSQFSAEMARLSAFIEPAAPLTRVAILYPLHTAWAKGPHHDHGAHFGAWCRHLNALDCDYLIVDERGLDDATFADGRLRISGCGFDAIVLPSAAVLKTCRTLARIAEFQSNGIALWTSGDEPRCLDAPESGMPALKANRRLLGVPSQDDVGALIAALPAIGPRINVPPETSLRRWAGFEPDGRWRLAFFNEGDKEASIEIGLPDGVESECWDPRNGLVSGVEHGRVLELSLEPHALVCLRMRQIPAAAPAITPAAPAMTVESVTTLGASWSLLAPGADHAVPIAVDRGWELQGFPALSGVGLYECEIAVDKAGFFVLDLPLVHTAVTVALDRREIARLGWPPYRAALGRLETGIHRLTLAVSNTAANRYYAGTPYRGARDAPSGLGAPPRLIRLQD